MAEASSSQQSFVETGMVASSMTNAIRTALFFVQRFGWLLLIGGLILYLVVKDRLQKRHLAQVFDPERVARLEEERRRKLEEHEERLRARAAQALDAKSLSTSEKDRKDARKFAPRTGKSDLPAPRDAKHFDSAGPGSGKPARMFSVQNRYPGKCGPSGG